MLFSRWQAEEPVRRRAYRGYAGVQSRAVRKRLRPAESSSETRLQRRVDAELVEVAELVLERCIRARLSVGAADTLVARDVRVEAVEHFEERRVDPAERHLRGAFDRDLRGGFFARRQDGDDRIDVVVADDGGRRAGDAGRAARDANRRGQGRRLVDTDDQAERQEVIP